MVMIFKGDRCSLRGGDLISSVLFGEKKIRSCSQNEQEKKEKPTGNSQKKRRRGLTKEVGRSYLLCRKRKGGGVRIFAEEGKPGRSPVFANRGGGRHWSPEGKRHDHHSPLKGGGEKKRGERFLESQKEGEAEVFRGDQIPWEEACPKLSREERRKRIRGRKKKKEKGQKLPPGESRGRWPSQSGRGGVIPAQLKEKKETSQKRGGNLCLKIEGGGRSPGGRKIQVKEE